MRKKEMSLRKIADAANFPLCRNLGCVKQEIQKRREMMGARNRKNACYRGGENERDKNGVCFGKKQKKKQRMRT